MASYVNQAWFIPIIVVYYYGLQTTFFVQLKKLFNVLRFLGFAFCVVRSDKAPVP